MRRLSESATDRGRSLWEAVLDFVLAADAPVSQGAVLRRFVRDDPAVVRAVLRDLVGSGILTVTGRGVSAKYRACALEDLDSDGASHEFIDAFVWVTVHRTGPTTRGELGAALHIPDAVLDASLARLLRDGRVTEAQRFGDAALSAVHCVIPFGASAGWEAAVFSHYQAVVAAIVNKLRVGQSRAQSADTIGGSTYTFDLSHGHPFEGQVLRLLGDVRERASSLRADVEAYNAEHPIEASAEVRVVFYVGQNVIDPADDDGGDV
jgi:hypothetical protein